MLFTTIATIIFGLLALMWKSSTWFNFLIRTVLITMAIYGIAILWPQITFIVK